jgi:hypothetical protein
VGPRHPDLAEPRTARHRPRKPVVPRPRRQHRG